MNLKVIGGLCVFVSVLGIFYCSFQRPSGGFMAEPSMVRQPEPKPVAVAPRTNAVGSPPKAPQAVAPAVVRETKDELQTALDQFQGWLTLYTNGSGNLVEGQRLAWQRQQAMLTLIKEDPRRALASALTYEQRQWLPPAIGRFAEEQVDGRGDFAVLAASDFTAGETTYTRWVTLGERRFQAYVYGRRLGQISQANLPVHGVALAGQLALSSEPLRLLSVAEARALAPAAVTPEAICSVSGLAANARQQEVLAEAGGAVIHFCGVPHFAAANAQLALAESGGTSVGSRPVKPSAAQDSWTHGRKTLLYIRVNFPDDLTEPISENAAYASMNGVNDFFTENSYDQVSLTATVTPVITMPQIKAYYSPDPALLLADARMTAAKAGYVTANYDRDIVALTSVPGYTWGGLAYVGGKGVWLQSYGAGVAAHELGHNFGLSHANFWDTTTNASMIGSGQNLEYGNIYDTMGPAAGGRAHFNAIHKNLLDWLKADAVQNITSNGVYRLYPFDIPAAGRVAGRSYAAVVRKDSLRDYWLEYRRQYTSNPWLQNGLLIDWTPWDFSNGGAQLVDTTPGSPNPGDTASRDDAAVVIGRTYADANNGVYITPVQRSQSGGEPWIDYQVNTGWFTNNRPPTVQIESEQSVLGAYPLVHFHAVAADPDGDTLAYAWSFDDLTFATNNQPWSSKQYSDAKEHVVRCIVSDMKGGEASANLVVTNAAATGYRLTGRVTDQSGQPIQGMLVGNGLVAASTFVGGWTDSDGRYVIVNVAAGSSLTLQPACYGYTFSNANWSNPYQPTNSTEGLDFVLTPLTRITITADTNTVPESDGSTHFFTITRQGDTNSDLQVNLGLLGESCTATPDVDFKILPDIGGTNNYLIIPAGSNQLTVAVNVVNDNLVEGPEDITLTLLSDTNLVNQAYVLGAPAEATITIQDDDAPVKPVVTVATATPVVEENGFDNGQWIFTRTGAPTGDLLVNYTITGTATAGSDYVPLAGVVLIPAGQSSVSLPLQVRDDKNVEADETVVLTLASSAAYTSGNPAAATITILDDDFMTVTVVPTGTAAEPSTPGSFTIKRDGDLTEALVVTYTVAGTAAPGVDYTALSGTATIPAGSASTVVPVMPSDDTLLEGQETVVVTLTSGPNYDIGTPGTATVLLNDNELPTLGITAAGSPVSEQGDATAHFTITRNGTSGNLTVPLQISGTATPGADYLPLDNPVIIPDGSASVTLDVIPFHDTILEPDETVVVTLPTGTNYNLGGAATASVVITDDATSQIPGVGFCFAASAWPEYQSPGIAVVLSTNLGQAVQVSYHVLPGSTAAPSRYALPDGVLTIPANSLVGFIPLAIIPNQVVDPPQNVKVVLFNPINATLDAIKVHTYTILDANAGSVSVTAITNTAAEAGPVSGAFRIARTGAATNAQVVNFQVTGTASAPSDYAPLGSSVIIPAGSNYVDLPVIPNHDGSQEPAQTVVLTLTSATNAAITSPNVATVTINDIDLNTLPIITLLTNHPYAYESGGDGSFDFYLAAPLTNNLTVNFVLGGTAGNGTDYLLVSNSVVIPAGQTNVSVLITPVDDGLVEGDETVVLSLVEATNYRVAYPGTATVIIQDNDQKIWVDASDFAAAKYSPTGIDPGQFTFTRFGTTNQAVTIYYAISGTASNGWDYVKITNNVVIPAGSWSATVPILPRHTGQIIGPVTATVTLLTNAAYALGSPTNATVLISDDMPGVSIFAVVTNVLEGSGSNGIFRVVRSGDPQYTFAPRLRVGGTATYGVDYPPFSTNLYFTCGQVSVDLYVNPTNEMVVEPDEVVQATLLPGAGYSLLSPTNAALTINDAGTNQTPQVQIISPAHGFAFLDGTNAGLVLNAVVTDDSTNDSLTWSKISGPDAYVFGNPTNNPTTVLFTNAGIYRLRLTADDGQLQGHADLIVFVGQATAGATNALHWSFNEGTGTNVLDDSGQGRNGLFNGTPVWLTNGIAAGALNFHGTNDSVRQTAGANTLNGLAAMTVSLWIRPPATNTSQGFLTGDDSGTNGTFNLGTQWVSGCGDATNVIDATLATPLGLFHRTTAGGTVTTGAWEHVALTWSNSTAPKIFINGKMDQANAGFVPVLGALTNCPQFVAGRGGWGSPASWSGALDEVRVFDQALSDVEVMSLAWSPVTNHAPIITVSAGQSVQMGVPVTFSGSVTDDGLPQPPGQVIYSWSYLGTNDLAIPDPSALTNTVVFTAPGDYTFRLTADDGDQASFADVVITVLEPIFVSVTADLPEANELGPVNGEFTLTRTGDTNSPLTVYLLYSGTASNGVDYLTMTNAVTFLAYSNTVVLPVIPILDYRIEGDESVVLTVQTNAAYVVQGDPGVVTLHDSPYGLWSIQHFTIEQLTFPNISGAAADFDHDGINNFSEYAFNLDPAVPDAGTPYKWAMETNSTGGPGRYLTFTWTRRLPPRDVDYSVFVSTNMLNWQTGSNYVTEVSSTPDPNGFTETVKTRSLMPFPGTNNLFMTIRVWLQQVPTP